MIFFSRSAFSDTDGPAYLYRIQVGTTTGLGFTASVWDSGLIFSGPGYTSKDFVVPYSGTQLSSGVTYAWRVQVQDGLSDGGWTSANDTFKINTLPTVISLKIDDNEILFEKGLLSKERSEINVSSVRTIKVKQSFFNRLFGVGSIEIYTAGDNPEIVVNGLPDPNRVRELIKMKQKGGI